MSCFNLFNFKCSVRQYAFHHAIVFRVRWCSLQLLALLLYFPFAYTVEADVKDLHVSSCHGSLFQWAMLCLHTHTIVTLSYESHEIGMWEALKFSFRGGGLAGDEPELPVTTERKRRLHHGPLGGWAVGNIKNFGNLITLKCK